MEAGRNALRLPEQHVSCEHDPELGTCGGVMRNVHSALSSWQKQEEMKDTSYGEEGKGIFRSARRGHF